MENIAVKLANPFAFKFVPKLTWNEFILTNKNIFKGYGNDIKNGFIRLSTHEQLYSTFTSKYLEREKCYFKLLAVNIDTVENIRWKKAKNGLVYPHAYSGLLLNRDILWVIDMDDYTFNCNGI